MVVSDIEPSLCRWKAQTGGVRQRPGQRDVEPLLDASLSLQVVQSLDISVAGHNLGSAGRPGLVHMCIGRQR